MKNKLWLLIIAIPLFSFSQEKLSYISNENLLTKIDSLDTAENYQKIIEALDAVNENDSIYQLVTIKKSYYHLMLEEYDKTIALCNKGFLIAKDDDEITSFYINKALAYSKSDRIDDGIKMYDEAIKKYPKNDTFYRRRGSLYQEKGDYLKAYDDLKQAIIINPHNANNHLVMGDLFFLENKFAQALMVYNMYLLLSPDGDSSFDVLNFLNEKFASRIDNEAKGVEYTKDDESFEEIDLFIKNRVALNKDYKFKNKVKIAYAKQNHVLFSLLEGIDVEDEFLKTYYTSIYHWMIENDKFEDFVYTTCYSIKNEKYQKVVRKNEKKVMEFYPAFIQQYTSKTEKINELFNGEIQEVYHSYNDDILSGIGQKKQGKYNGLWEFYNDSGRMSAKGSFDENEERTGQWIWYGHNGIVVEKLDYVAGKANGTYTVFYPNGNVKIEGIYKDDQLEGNYKYYNSKGALSEDKNFKEGKLDGAFTSYYRVGKDVKDYELVYKAGEVDGTLKEFYDNGNLYCEIDYLNGSKEGKTKYYFKNKQVYKEYKNVNGLISGKFQQYYVNGKTAQAGIYVNDKLDSIWNVYYANGVIEEIIQYKQGKLNGDYKEYSPSGHLYGEHVYRRGKLYKTKFYDLNDKALYDAKKENNKLDYRGYGFLGNLTTQGLYDVKGGKEGEWKYYDRNGVLASIQQNKDGLVYGASYNYYKNGKEKSISEFKDDQLNGYSVGYYQNGQIKNQGYNSEDQKDKEWRSYYVDGTLSQKNFFHKGDFHGTQYYYRVDGTLDYTYTYEFGDLKSHTIYGKTEKDTLEFLNYEKMGDAPKVVTRYYADKKSIDNKTTYVSGVLHGEASYYYPSGELFSKGVFNNGKRHKKWQWFYKDGTLMKDVEYDSDLINGDYNYYHENGNLKNHVTYILDEIDGEDITYANDGKTIVYSIEYLLGDRNGASKFYDRKGNLQLIRYYDMGILKGYSYLDKQGKLLEMIPIENETAKIVSYYQNGNVARDFEIKNGVFVNKYLEYYYNGQLWEDTTYINGEREGEYTEYYENGVKKKESNHVCGFYQGAVIEYHDNGTIQEKSMYKNGDRHGSYEKYDKEGNLLEKGTSISGDDFKEGE